GIAGRSVQLHGDADASLLVALNLGVAGALLAAESNADASAAAQVAPPHLALGPHHRDRHAVAVLPVADREREVAPAAPARDRDQRQPPADDRVERRLEQEPDELIAGAVEDGERCVAAGHGARAYAPTAAHAMSTLGLRGFGAVSMLPIRRSG